MAEYTHRDHSFESSTERPRLNQESDAHTTEVYISSNAGALWKKTSEKFRKK